jgi:ATP-binding cassette, subfamily C, bacterial
MLRCGCGTTRGGRCWTAQQLPANATLRLADVAFAWSADAEPVVNNLSLHLRAGEHLAVVGPSGVGKSTLAALMSGLLAPGAGSVRVGGVNLREADEAALGRAVALIPQESYVFAGTLRET